MMTSQCNYLTGDDAPECHRPPILKASNAASLKDSVRRQIAALALAPVLAITPALAVPGVTTADVKIRSGPGTNYASIEVLAAGSEIDIGECDAGGVVRRHRKGPPRVRQRPLPQAERRAGRLAARLRRRQGPDRPLSAAVHRVDRLQDDRGARGGRVSEGATCASRCSASSGSRARPPTTRMPARSSSPTSPSRAQLLGARPRRADRACGRDRQAPADRSDHRLGGARRRRASPSRSG